MARWACAVAGGVGAALWWPSFGHLAVAGVLAVALVLAVWRPARMLLLVSVLAALWATVHASVVLTSRVGQPQSGVLEGCVTTGVVLRDRRVQFGLSATRFDGRAVRWRLQVSGYDGVRVPRFGECWRFAARVRPPRTLLNFAGADAERRAFVQRLSGRAAVKLDANAARLDDDRAVRVRYSITRLRLSIARRVQFVTGEGTAWPVIVALAVGLRDGMPTELRAQFAATGTGHLMAISGLHVGLVAALGWLGGRWLVAPVLRVGARAAGVSAAPVDRFAPLVCGALLAMLYAAIAGLSTSTQRALIMLLVFSLAAARGRRLGLIDGLALALCLVLAVAPLSFLSPGLWLSFGAVAALGSLSLHVAPSPWRAQGVAFVGVLPVLAAGLGQVAWVSPLANAVCVPAFSLGVIPAVLLVVPMAFAPVSWVAAGFAALATIIDVALTWLAGLAALPGAHGLLPAVSLWHVGLAVVALVLLLSGGRRPERVVLALTMCLPLVVSRAPVTAHGHFVVESYDVAHGLAVAIHTRHHTVLYDTGGQWQSSNAGERIVLPQLAARGVRSLDTLVLSHGDLDHRGGATAVRRALPVVHWLSGEPARSGGGAPCQAGWQRRLDGVTFEVLHPPPGSQLIGNNVSCVLRVNGRHGSALLTGDLERLGEVALAYGGKLGPVDLVVGQHHGSKTSSGKRFIDAVQARYVWFSTAYDNRWSHPAPEVLQRWTLAGARPCSTALSGALRADFDGQPGGVRTQRARAHRPALWRWLPPESTEDGTGAFRVRTGRDILLASC